mmetsp:Transcript_63584/g.143059  ORF Transcript_63584/g.143059 Transcript_63584/m.143059 type:complete len:236 (-) Transcript_63584:108-815(-)
MQVLRCSMRRSNWSFSWLPAERRRCISWASSSSALSSSAASSRNATRAAASTASSSKGMSPTSSSSRSKRSARWSISGNWRSSRARLQSLRDVCSLPSAGAGRTRAGIGSASMGTPFVRCRMPRRRATRSHNRCPSAEAWEYSSSASDRSSAKKFQFLTMAERSRATCRAVTSRASSSMRYAATSAPVPSSSSMMTSGSSASNSSSRPTWPFSSSGSLSASAFPVLRWCSGTQSG